MGSEIIYLFVPVAAVLATLLAYLAYRESTRRYALSTLGPSFLLGSFAALDGPTLDLASFSFWFVGASAIIGPVAFGMYFSSKARQSSGGEGRT